MAARGGTAQPRRCVVIPTLPDLALQRLPSCARYGTRRGQRRRGRVLHRHRSVAGRPQPGREGWWLHRPSRDAGARRAPARRVEEAHVRAATHLVPAVVAGALILSACGGDDDAPAAHDPLPEPTPTTPASSPVPPSPTATAAREPSPSTVGEELPAEYAARMPPEIGRAHV